MKRVLLGYAVLCTSHTVHRASECTFFDFSLVSGVVTLGMHAQCISGYPLFTIVVMKSRRVFSVCADHLTRYRTTHDLATSFSARSCRRITDSNCVVNTVQQSLPLSS